MDALDRLLSRVVVTRDGCWEHTGAPDNFGYRHFRLNGRRDRAHRAAYALLIQPIPAGLVICHRCDNPACIRPDHLAAGTHADNIADRDAKGRTAKGTANGRAKLDWPTVRLIRYLAAMNALPNKAALARELGVTPRAINQVLHADCWREE